MGKFRSIFIIAVLSALVMMSVACSSKEPSNQLAGVSKEGQTAAMDQKEQAEDMAKQEGQTANVPVRMAQPAASTESPRTIELTGMVEQSGDGVVLVTDLGKYNVMGQDLSEMVGKTVKVTGAVEESAGQYTINVESVKESE